MRIVDFVSRYREESLRSERRGLRNESRVIQWGYYSILSNAGFNSRDGFDMPADFKFRASPLGIDKVLQNMDFLTKRDFEKISKKRAKNVQVPIGFVYSPNREDYAEVFINMGNNLSLMWHSVSS